MFFKVSHLTVTPVLLREFEMRFQRVLYWLSSAWFYTSFHKHGFILAFISMGLYWLSLVWVYTGFHQYGFILAFISTVLYWLSVRFYTDFY